ncbi:MAG: recombinase family protein [Polaromonas sp.]
MIYVYARVSRTKQETTLQTDALKRAGVDKIFQEKYSSVGKRPMLQLLIATLQPGDAVKVWKMDRVARSLLDLLSTIQRIERAGASFQSLTEHMDTTTSHGRMMMHVLGAFAEFERSIITERTKAGQNAARERGIHCGRSRNMLPEHELEVQKLYNTPGRWYSLASLAKLYKVHPSTIKRCVYRTNKPGHSSLD